MTARLATPRMASADHPRLAEIVATSEPPTHACQHQTGTVHGIGPVFPVVLSPEPSKHSYYQVTVDRPRPQGLGGRPADWLVLGGQDPLMPLLSAGLGMGSPGCFLVGPGTHVSGRCSGLPLHLCPSDP